MSTLLEAVRTKESDDLAAIEAGKANALKRYHEMIRDGDNPAHEQEFLSVLQIVGKSAADVERDIAAVKRKARCVRALADDRLPRAEERRAQAVAIVTAEARAFWCRLGQELDVKTIAQVLLSMSYASAETITRRWGQRMAEAERITSAVQDDQIAAYNELQELMRDHAWLAD